MATRALLGFGKRQVCVPLRDHQVRDSSELVDQPSPDSGFLKHDLSLVISLQSTGLAGADRKKLAQVLDRVPTRRLVVLGEPGAGKTMLLVRLVLDLLTRRAPGDSVPVLVSLASWNPVEQDLYTWLGGRLRPSVHPDSPLPVPRPPSKTRDRRRDCTDRRTDDEGCRSPNSAAWSGSPVPGAQPRTSPAADHSYSLASSWPSSTSTPDLLAHFAMRHGFPGPGLLRSRRPVRRPQQTTRLPLPRAGCTGQR